MNISQQDRQKYQGIFQSSGPINGKISGQQASQIFSQSNLPKPKLAEIWNLSDLDKDGQLDIEEFTLAMHLIFSTLNGSLQNLPQTLPPSLLPQSKAINNNNNYGFKPNLALPAATSNMSPTSTGSKALKYDWHVPSHDRSAYEAIFTRFSSNPMGYLTYHQTQNYFIGKGLNIQDVQQTWTLVDVQKSGSLHKDQFAMLLHILNWKSKGIQIPQSLPIHMQNQFRSGPKEAPSPYQNNTPQLSNINSNTSSPGYFPRQSPAQPPQQQQVQNRDLLDFDLPNNMNQQSSIPPPIQPTNSYQSSSNYQPSYNTNNNTDLFNSAPKQNDIQPVNNNLNNTQPVQSGPSAYEIDQVKRELQQVEAELSKSEGDQLIINTMEDFQGLEQFLNQLIKLTKYQNQPQSGSLNEEKIKDLGYLETSIERKYSDLQSIERNLGRELEELNLKINDLKYSS